MSSPAPSRLQLEIKQRVPFDSIRSEALVAVLHTADVIRRRTTKTLEPFGITMQQYNVLRILRGAGGGGLPTLEIADRMIEQAPGITRMIDRLETKELVSRERGCADRRQVVCRIRTEGLELLKKVDAPLQSQTAIYAGSAEESDLATLITILDKVRTAPEV